LLCASGGKAIQPKLEHLLEEKERELKLYQKFLDLRAYCEEAIFPKIDLPLKDHTEALKRLIERILPDPKDRTEELFSGEIFVLLCATYLHDTGFIKHFEWSRNREILNSHAFHQKQLLLNYEIAEKLKIPLSAMEIVNGLIFSHEVRKIPMEWEIEDDGKKAIIRNTKILESVFNFAHAILDVFYSDLRHSELRRTASKDIVLRPENARVDIDSREGQIHIGYDAHLPYEFYALERAKERVEHYYALFKDQVNGRLGFQYSTLTWDVSNDFIYNRDHFELPKFSPYNEFERPPFNRWEEISGLLDKLFLSRRAVVVGEVGTGKTTILQSFLVPHLSAMAKNVFYCELWKAPVSEIRYIISKRHGHLECSGLDITSICKYLAEEGPCFFIIDSCERLIGIDNGEREKFERFVSFSMEQTNTYLVIAGDKETFFDWYSLFGKITMSSLFEIRPVKSHLYLKVPDEGRTFSDTNEYCKPIECELLSENLNIETILTDIMGKMKDNRDFRSLVAVLLGNDEKQLWRYSLDDIVFETNLTKHQILSYLELLKEWDIVKESEHLDVAYYSLSSRYLRETLYKILRLDEFEEKRKIRNLLQNAIVNDSFLDDAALALIGSWKDNMVFSPEGMGWILSSLIFRSKDYRKFFEKAKHDGSGIDVQPILKLVCLDDTEGRGKAIRLLAAIQDKGAINPLLLHLKEEKAPEIKKALISGVGLTRKKRALVAIINTLQDIGDRQLRLNAIDFLHSLADGRAKEFLVEIREKEKDPIVLMRIDDLLAREGQSE
jgi:hypothetical protein